MRKRFLSMSLVVVMVTGILAGGFPTITRATADLNVTILDVDGDQVQIFRDEFGVPHIFADTDRGLFVAFGFTVAEDRLWQLEVNRRAARGQLAEIFGPDFLNADIAIRTVGYTDDELTAMFASLPAEEQAQIQAYVEGVNRYITEVVLPDTTTKLPAEFFALGITPGLWSVNDVVAFVAAMTRNFGEIGGRELRNQETLTYLVSTYGEEQGYAIFNDVRWINDPDSPVTVPTRGAAITPVRKAYKPEQLRGAGLSPSVSLEEAKKEWERIGVPTKLGSYAWALASRRSAAHGAMLYGGPQMGFSTPAILLEVQLTGGEMDYNVRGMTFAGAPGVIIGHNPYLAWTSTTGTGDNLDTYIEVLCDAGFGPASGYSFTGDCIPFEARSEVIDVAGAGQTTVTVLRSLHGPVVGLDAAAGFAVSQKRAHWMREAETLVGWFRFGRARDLGEFEAAVDMIVTSHNFLYADKADNIAYWQAGEVPVRPEGFDPRLPLPGTGEAEWTADLRPTPKAINPAHGWLANWNNKPAADFDNADENIFGKQFRLWDIEERLAQDQTKGQLSLADMEDIPKDIGRVKELGRDARFLKPYLLDALQVVGTGHSSGPAAVAILEAWDGSAVSDAVTSTAAEPGEVIFSTWLDLMIQATFADELGPEAGEAGTNMLLHVLDAALGRGSGVPPSRDYLNGQDPNQVMSATFDQALHALTLQFGTPDPYAWVVPRGSIDFNHPFLPISVGSIPLSNRATYGQIVIYGRQEVTAQSIQPLGQSGFISTSGQLDPHFTDQLNLFRNFQHKDMRLLPEPPGP